MRRALVFVWLLLPVGGVAYHFGPGQERLRHDAVGAALERATAAVARAEAAGGATLAREDWVAAEAAFGDALAKLGSGRVAEARAIRLERAKAQMFLSRLPEARGDLETLCDELIADPAADATVLAGAREALANAQYYMTWLMRLEGRSRDEWETEIQASRQNYKLLAEVASASGDAALAKRAGENLESSVRLQRMQLDELQGLPLPSQ